MLRLLFLLPLLLVGCQPDAPAPAKPIPPPKPVAKAAPTPSDHFTAAGGAAKVPPSNVKSIVGGVKVEKPEPAPMPPATPARVEADEDPFKDALPLPAAPKADPKSEHKPMQEDNSLILETKPDKTKRLLVQCEVCLREGPLELFLCKKQSKEHESVLRTDVDAQFLHAALVSLGAKAGAPVQFINPKTEEPEYKPASGSKIAVSVHFTRAGKPVTESAKEWIQDIKTKKPMDADFVFAGSRLVANGDKPGEPKIYTANLGEVISVSNKRDSMLEIPIKSTDADADLLFAVATEKVPPLGSKVWLILETIAEKDQK